MTGAGNRTNRGTSQPHLGGRAEPVGNDFAGSTIEFKAGRDLIPGLDETPRDVPMGIRHDP
jgi:hypothetical protein